MADLVGSTLDRYRILEDLGEDAWGRHLKAFDAKADQYVIIHLLKPERVAHEDSIEYITQVARAAMHWHHPGIARIFEIKETEVGAYIVREFIPGDSLFDLVERLKENKKWISLNEAVQLERQVLAALEFAHQRGIIHGDLGPQHIYICEQPSEGLLYQPVLVNFGYNRPESPQRASLPAYEPPEQAAGGKIDARADIYAAGILLYELTTRYRPRPADGKGSPDQRSSAEIKSPRSLRPDLPEAIEKVILRATAVQPDDRYEDVQTMSAELAKALATTSRAPTTPLGPKEITSILYALKASLPAEEAAEEPQPSMPEVAANISEASFDQIHILLADKTIHNVRFKPGGMTIGRGNDNDIVLNQPSASRHHARIEFDGQSYRVIDLGSRNGTYVGSERLEPHQPRLWPPGENMRVGDSWLRLERASQGKSTVVEVPQPPTPPEPETVIETDFKLVHPDGGTIDPTQVKYSPGAAHLGVYLESPNLNVSPGGQAPTSLLLINRGKTPDVFRLTFVGVPLDWIPNRPQSISMPPDSQRPVPISFQPPRSADSRAGRHMVTIRVTSQKDPTQVVEVTLAITISSFAQFTSELRPKRLRSGAAGQVIIRNQGNLPETYSVGWDDKQAELQFEPPIAKITVPPGHAGSLSYKVRARQARWFGSETLHSYGVVVSAQTGQFQTQAGEFANRAIVPPWAPVVLAAMCLVLACASILLINQFTAPTRRAQQTDVANQTALAANLLATSMANTATAQAASNVSQSTAQAGTATAAWLLADDDNDGLTNNQEALFGTKPDQADTDQDGLKDGEEIQVYKTDPLKPDTDGDGLKDGDEVLKYKTDPLKRDTDGDGLEDGVDPDPLHASTKTPTRGPTVTPTGPTSTVSPSTDLAVTVDNGSPTSVPGASLAYTIRVRNNGPGAVTNAQVLDTLPDAVINISWTCTATSGSYCRTASGFGNIDVRVDLLVNGEITFIVSGTVNPGATGLLINTANVALSPGVTETNPTNNAATDTDNLTPKVSFAFSLTDNRVEVLPGASDVYTIVATNAGPSTANGVTITDVFPDLLTNISWLCTTSGGSSCAPTGVQGGNVNVSANIRPGGSVSITVNVKVKDTAAGTLTNTANLSSPIDPGANNKSAVDVTTITPVVDLGITVSAPVTAGASSPITYTLSVTNAGPALATNVTLSDDLPSGVTFVSSDPGSPTCNELFGVVSCNLGNLAPGASVDVKIAILTPGSTGTISNQAQVDASEQEAHPADNTVTTQVQIV